MMDEDRELEELRRRKMAQMQQQQEHEIARQQMAAQQQAEVEAQKQAILRQIMTPEARERLARIRMTKPDVAQTIEMQLIQLAQAGRIQQMIDDATLRALLERAIPKKREIKIERR
jgi:programmed cell death protein 5